MKYRLCKLIAPFSIRDLLWLILLAAVFSAWQRDRAFCRMEREELQYQVVVKARKLEIERDELNDQREALRNAYTQLNAENDAIVKTELERKKSKAVDWENVRIAWAEREEARAEAKMLSMEFFGTDISTSDTPYHRNIYSQPINGTYYLQPDSAYRMIQSEDLPPRGK